MEFKELEEKFKKNIEHLKEELSSVQAQKATPILLKNIIVKFDDGRKNNILEIAAVRNINNMTLGIKPYDKSSTKAIEKALTNADLGTHPAMKDDEIYLIFPDITTERRKELAKSIVNFANHAKLLIRTARHDYIKQNKKSNKEEEVRQEKEIQKIIDKVNKQIDEIIEKKQKEILS